MEALAGARKGKGDMLSVSADGGASSQAYQQMGQTQMQHGIRLRMTAKLEDLLANTQQHGKGMQIEPSRLQIVMNADSNEAKVSHGVQPRPMHPWAVPALFFFFF